MIDKRTSIVVTILTIIMTFMEMTALPAALFCNIHIRDIESAWNDETGSYRNDPYLQGQKYPQTIFKQ